MTQRTDQPEQHQQESGQQGRPAGVYLLFAAMIATSTVVMFLLSYTARSTSPCLSPVEAAASP